MSYTGIGFKSFNNLAYSFDAVNVAFDNTLLALFTRVMKPSAPTMIRVAKPTAPTLTRVTKPTAPIYTRIG
jgi:hypothetical protein